MEYREIVDLLGRFVDGTELTSQEFLALFDEGYIEKVDNSAWALSDYGKKIISLILHRYTDDE